MPTTLPLDVKASGYYGQERAHVISHLPTPAGRVLDVGCGEGGAAGLLRSAGASELTGIEIMEAPAQIAQRSYDRVVVGDALTVLDQIEGPFDTILAYDVLEHLYDPLALLRGLIAVAAPGARLHVSVPNAGHVSLLYDLIVRGSFNYQPHGHRDATHLRWFTGRDIAALVSEAGWTVTDRAPGQLGRPGRTLASLTRGRSTDFLAAQWYVLATRA